MDTIAVTGWKFIKFGNGNDRNARIIRTRMTTQASSLQRSIIEVLGSPQGKSERSASMVYWLSMLVMAVVISSGWFFSKMGPGHPSFAILLTVWTSMLTPGVAIPAVRVLMRLFPRHRFRVPAGERALHFILGVAIFGWLLQRSGYHRRVVHPLRGFNGTKAGLQALEQSVLGGLIAHGVLFFVHLLLSLAALLAGYAWGALWIITPGVVLHFYPVMLQRSIMLRLQPLLDRTSSKIDVSA